MKSYKKVLAIGCSVVLAMASLSGCSTDTSENVTGKSDDEVESIKDSLSELGIESDVVGHSDTAGKEETVYAILDAEGNKQQVIVSEWLKNPKGSKKLEDKSTLSDITVVKGDAEYKKGDSDEITWSGDGEDIYYQGISEEKLPVDMSIAYELDGEKIAADKLLGASGHLKITISYKNNCSKEVTVNGKKTTIYQPFVMITGMMLDSAKAENVTADNGSVVNSGDNTVVIGMAMPGLQESLGIHDLKDKDGKKVDFEIPESVIVEADVTDFSLMNTLTLASNSALTNLGLDDIETVDDLKSDMNKLKKGMKEIIDGATKLDDNVPALTDGIKTMKDGTGKLSTGLETLTGKNLALNNGISELSTGLSTLNSQLNNKKNLQSINELTAGSTTFSTKLNEASTGLAKICKGYDYNQGDVQALIAGLTQYKQYLVSQSDQTSLTYAQYLDTMINLYKSLYNDTAKAAAGVNGLSAAYEDIDEGIQTAAGSISSVAKASKKLSKGANDLKDGISTYTGKVDEVYAGVKKLDSGADKLIEGVSKLSDGTEALKEGVIKFNDEGIRKLAEIVNDDLDMYFNRLKAIQNYSKEYTTYAGCSDNVECSVRFIYKTDAIE